MCTEEAWLRGWTENVHGIRMADAEPPRRRSEGSQRFPWSVAGPPPCRGWLRNLLSASPSLEQARMQLCEEAPASPVGAVRTDALSSFSPAPCPLPSPAARPAHPQRPHASKPHQSTYPIHILPAPPSGPKLVPSSDPPNVPFQGFTSRLLP